MQPRIGRSKWPAVNRPACSFAPVEFGPGMLVGGLAVNAWGYLRATRDVDFVPDPQPENLARLKIG